MTDDQAPGSETASHDLRAILVRLEDLQRKCRAAASRNDEAAEIEARISTVLDRLKSPDEDNDEPIPFTALARQLFAVERFFESNGFLTVAKEVAHVERSLEALAPADEQLPEAPYPEGEAGGEARDDDEPIDREGPSSERVSRWAVPRPLALVLLLFVVAVSVCGVIIYRHLQPSPLPVSEPPAPTPQPTTPPTTATPFVGNDESEPTPAPGAILAREIGQARLALNEGDIDDAIDHLSVASLIDPDHRTVLGTASQIVALLIERANDAANSGLWEIAELTLARATRIASRYDLDTQPIDDAARAHARMDRYRLIRPSDAQAIRAAAGRAVTVHFKDGRTLDSIINGVEAGELLLNEDNTVRGGAMYYIERIPLAEIDYIKVWEN
jgi:hypothetical protein